MAVNLDSRRDENEVMLDINTTPLIDVMLVLLVMLIITIPVQTHAIKLDMPRDAEPPIVEPVVVNLVVDFDGTTLWDGEILPDRTALESHLKTAAQQEPQPEIHIAPNKLVKYSYVAMVLAETQRLGVSKIGIVGNEQFME